MTFLRLDDPFAWDGWYDALEDGLLLAEGLDCSNLFAVQVAVEMAVGRAVLDEWARHHGAVWCLLHNQTAFADPRDLARHVRRYVTHGQARPCPACGEPVLPGRKGRVYCSSSCRQRAYRARRGIRPSRNTEAGNPADELAFLIPASRNEQRRS